MPRRARGAWQSCAPNPQDAGQPHGRSGPPPGSPRGAERTPGPRQEQAPGEPSRRREQRLPGALCAVWCFSGPTLRSAPTLSPHVRPQGQAPLSRQVNVDSVFEPQPYSPLQQSSAFILTLTLRAGSSPHLSSGGAGGGGQSEGNDSRPSPWKEASQPRASTGLSVPWSLTVTAPPSLHSKEGAWPVAPGQRVTKSERRNSVFPFGWTERKFALTSVGSAWEQISGESYENSQVALKRGQRGRGFWFQPAVPAMPPERGPAAPPQPPPLLP